MDKQELVQIIDKEDKSKTDEMIITSSEMFNDRLSEIRNKDPDAGWKAIATKLAEEFKVKLNHQTLENRYIKEAAVEIQIDAYAEKQFTKYIGKMANRYDRLIRISDKMSQAAEAVIDKITNENISAASMEELLMIVKLIKPIEPLLKTTLTQLEFVREEQDKITTKLSQNRKEVSEDDIRAKAQGYTKDVLEVLEAQNKIKIYDRKILKR